MHVNGVVKDSCWPINWPNIVEEFTRVKNHLNVTCAINGLLIQGMSFFYSDYNFVFWEASIVLKLVIYLMDLNLNRVFSGTL